jgi:hypothetical protein
VLGQPVAGKSIFSRLLRMRRDGVNGCPLNKARAIHSDFHFYCP